MASIKISPRHDKANKSYINPNDWNNKTGKVKTTAIKIAETQALSLSMAKTIFKCFTYVVTETKNAL